MRAFAEPVEQKRGSFLPLFSEYRIKRFNPFLHFLGIYAWDPRYGTVIHHFLPLPLLWRAFLPIQNKRFEPAPKNNLIPPKEFALINFRPTETRTSDNGRTCGFT